MIGCQVCLFLLFLCVSGFTYSSSFSEELGSESCTVRCASDLDEKCSVSEASEVVVTGKTHLDCVESSERLCCASCED